MAGPESPIGILLSAGRGTRLRPLSQVRPKALVPLHWIPLVEFGLRQLIRAGCRLIALNSHHLADQLCAYLERRQVELPEIEIRFFKEENLLGVGGGLRRMLAELPPGPVLVQNADVLHDFDLARLHKEHLRRGAPLTLVGGGDPPALELRDGHVHSLRDPAKANLGFTGVHLIGDEVRRELGKWDRSSIIPFYQGLLERGFEINGADRRDALWFDLGELSRYLPLHSLLWEEKSYHVLLKRLGLAARWDPQRRLSVPPGSRLPEDAVNCVAWSDVRWTGTARDSLLLDGVRGNGDLKGEIVL